MGRGRAASTAKAVLLLAISCIAVLLLGPFSISTSVSASEAPPRPPKAPPLKPPSKAKPKPASAPKPGKSGGSGAGDKAAKAADLKLIEDFFRVFSDRLDNRCFSSGTFVFEIPAADAPEFASWDAFWQAVLRTRVSRGIAKTHNLQSMPDKFKNARWCKVTRQPGDKPCDNNVLRGGGCTHDAASQYEVQFPRALEYLCKPQCTKPVKDDDDCQAVFRTPKEAGLNYRFCLTDSTDKVREYVFFKLEETGTQGVANKIKHTGDFIAAKTGRRVEPPGYEFRRDTEVDYWTRNCPAGAKVPKVNANYQCARTLPETMAKLREKVLIMSSQDFQVFASIIEYSGPDVSNMVDAMQYFDFNVRVGAEMFVPSQVTDAIMREVTKRPKRPVHNPKPPVAEDDDSAPPKKSTGPVDDDEESFTVGGPPKDKSPLAEAMDGDDDDPFASPGSGRSRSGSQSSGSGSGSGDDSEGSVSGGDGDGDDLDDAPVVVPSRPRGKGFSKPVSPYKDSFKVGGPPKGGSPLSDALDQDDD